jgi:hypothetical protein
MQGSHWMSTFNCTCWRAAFVATIAFVATGIALYAQTSPRTRLLPHGRNLVEQLRPDDQIVVIMREYDAAVPYRRPTASESIKDLTDTAHAIAMVEVRSAAGEFVENGEWVQTRIIARVEDVVRSVRPLLTVGQQTDLFMDGGEAKLGSVLVRANLALRLSAGRR